MVMGWTMQPTRSRAFTTVQRKGKASFAYGDMQYIMEDDPLAMFMRQNH